MATVCVDVDLGDLEFDDLVDEIISRLKYFSRLTKREKERLNKLKDVLNEKYVPVYENVTGVDKWKDDLWPEIKQKYSLEELEALIPNKYIRA